MDLIQSDILLMGRDKEGGSRQVSCPGGQGKGSPAAFGFVASGQEEGGSGTPAARAALLLYAADHVAEKKKKKKT